MIAQSQIREEISHYLDGKISLDHFEDWLVQQSWNMHLDSDKDAQKLVAAIELRLGEYSSGHLTRDELRTELTLYVTRFTERIEFGAAPVLYQHIESRNVSFAAKAQIMVFPSRMDQSFPVASVVVGTEHAAILA